MSRQRGDGLSPKYPLDRFKQVFPVTGIVTKQALSDANRLGFGPDDIEQVIQYLRSEEFYKSMPAQKVQGAWQDVYRTKYMAIPLYIKLQFRESGKTSSAVVISFKTDNSAS